MKISIIAACDKNRLIGVDGKMPWHNVLGMQEDLKRFKKITIGKGNNAVVMGRKTFTSLNQKTLPYRSNIVVTSQYEPVMAYHEIHKCYIVSTIELAIVIMESARRDECFLIGGERIFEEGLQYADTIYLTEVDGEYDGVDQESKRYFPVLNDKEWQLVRAERVRGVPCSFMVYRKIK